MKKILFAIILIIVVTLFTGCPQIPDGGKFEDFESPAEFMENSTISRAIFEKDFSIKMGESPPNFEGVYNLTGTITDSDISDAIGMAINSIMRFYDQTSDGLINCTERIGTISVSAYGNYVTGEGNSFTIWQEATAEIGKAKVYNAVIISGTKLPNGDLETKTMTVNLKKENAEEYRIPEWYESTINFELRPLEPPRELSAKIGSWSSTLAKVILYWTLPEDTKYIRKYYIYRDGDCLSALPIPSFYTSYTLYQAYDTTKSYSITSVDTYGNESKHSNTLDLTVPPRSYD